MQDAKIPSQGCGKGLLISNTPSPLSPAGERERVRGAKDGKNLIVTKTKEGGTEG